MGRLRQNALRSGLALAICGMLGRPGRADEFDRLEGPALAGVADDPATIRRDRLTLAEILGQVAVLAGSRSPLVVVATDLGNAGCLLIAPAYRKPPGGAGEPVPILVLERFATFEMPGALTRLARGRDLILFDGFQVDLDTGQVVPDGQGGDLRFRADGPDGPRLEPIGDARLFTPTRSPIPTADPRSGPSAGRAVVPGDFSGRYRLYANGQWSGRLDLDVDASGAVAGRFRSDLHGEVYTVEGQAGAAAGATNRLRFTVALPRVRPEYEGYLWTEGKGAIAGTLTMLDRPFGFFAIREGGRVAPSDEEPVPIEAGAGAGPVPGRVRVEVDPDGRFRIGDKPFEDAEALTEALREQREAEPSTSVVLHAAPDRNAAGWNRAIDSVRVAGIRDVRLDLEP